MQKFNRATATSCKIFIFKSVIFLRFPYFGEEGIYDDSGYSVEMNENNWQETIAELNDQRWLDRKSRVVFLEMTHMNPVTYWFVFLLSYFLIKLCCKSI